MPVLLGMIDVPVESNQVTDCTTNKVGGLPNWLACPPASSPCCGLCGRLSPLVVQVNCPLFVCSYDRNLYVFACVNKHCWNKSESWTVLRSQQQNTAKVETECSAGSANCDDSDDAIDWCSSADEWDDDWGSNAADGGFDAGQIENEAVTPGVDANSAGNCEEAGNGDSTMAEQVERLKSLSITSLSPDPATAGSPDPGHGGGGDGKGAEHVLFDSVTAQPMSENLGDILTFPGVKESGLPNDGHSEPQAPDTGSVETLTAYYINVFEAPSGASTEDYWHEERLLVAYARKEGVNVTGLLDGYTEEGGTGKERYEKVEVRHGDQTFLKFAKRLQAYPEQIIRYEYGGTPVLMRPLSSSDAAIAASPCPECGQVRVYEMQLMPTLVTKLTTCAQGAVVEFGTVLIYTCEQSCWSDDVTTPRREQVIVQPGPDIHLFR